MRIINLRNATTAEWERANPILADDEVGIEIASFGPPAVLKMKVGRAGLDWLSLPYFSEAVAGATGPQGPAGPTGPQGPTGPAGADGSGITIKGSVATSGDLPASGTTGDGYIAQDSGHLWIWPQGGSAWLDVGQIVGPAGPTGATGPTGPAGPAGPTGATGATGAAGAAGPAGATGPAGPAGPAGAAGAKGDKGDTGPAGTGGDPTLGGTYGGDPTGVTAADSALAAAKAAGVKRLRLDGTFRLNSKALINSQMEIYGDGPDNSFLDVYTTTDHGMEITGSSSLKRIQLRDFTLRYKGAGQAAGKHGLVIKRSVYMDNVVVSGFTGSGIRFDSIDGTVGGAVFFAVLRNVRSTLNGLDGLEVRFGANANLFVNFQGDKNGRYGVHHYNDGGATYANTWIGGQTSYNSLWGWNMESGSDIKLEGVYAEYNCSPDNTNTHGYTASSLSTTERRGDFRFSDAVNRVTANLSAVLNNDSTHVLVPSGSTCYSNRIEVKAGGLRYTPMCAAVSTAAATTVSAVDAKVNALITALKNGKVVG